MNGNSIYIVFSSTPYAIGKMIRRIAKTQYNHVSISLDRELTQMYSFARRYYHAPFFGGFVKETPARFQLREKRSKICICRIPVTLHQYRDVEQLLQHMHARKDHYLYNHLSAVSSLVRRRVDVDDAYTCVEFAIMVLDRLGFSVSPERYYTVPELWKLLEKNVVFTGFMPTNTTADPTYYTNKPIVNSYRTVRDFVRLLPRSWK